MMIMCLSVLPSFASAEEVVTSKNVLKHFKDINVAIGSNSKYKIKLDKPIKGQRVRHKFYVELPPGVKKDSLYVELSTGNSWVATHNFGHLFGNKDKGEFVLEVLGNSYDTVSLINHTGVNVVIKELIIYVPGGADGYETFEDISKLNVVEGVNDVNFTWENPVNSTFSGVSVYKDGEFLKTVDKSVNSYKVEGLEGNKNYNFQFVALYGENKSLGIQKGVKTLVDPKTIPPSPVSSLTAEPTDKTVKLKWKKPKDDDLAGFKILQNGKQIAEIGLEEEFTVKNLQPLTDYTFGVIAVDRDKNDSSSVNLSVKTLEENDEEPPHVPANVFAKPSNGALIASWDKVADKDLAGYNVYVDDKKINSNLVSSTNFTIKNLENNRKYKIQVQAVDRSGNASALSLAAYGTPDEKTLPIIESKYSLQDVSDGVSVMFGQFWTVLAFAVGIPLAFYIIYKLKLTVLP